MFLAAALRSLRPGGRAGIVFPNGILFGDTNAHIEVKKRLLAECDLQAVVTLPKGMFEPYTPNPPAFSIFQKTGKPTKETWFYNVRGRRLIAQKGAQVRPAIPATTFPTCWQNGRSARPPTAWRGACPATSIIDNGYNMTLASLGLIEAAKTKHAEPEEILAARGRKGAADFANHRGDAGTCAGLAAGVRRLLSSAPMRPLGSCGFVVGGGTPSKENRDYWGGNIPWVTAKEMWNFEVIDSQLKITEAALKASPTKLIPVDSVLFVVRGSILFKRVPVAINRVVCTINQDMKAIVPGEGILGDYIAHMMWGANAEIEGAGRHRGK